MGQSSKPSQSGNSSARRARKFCLFWGSCWTVADSCGCSGFLAFTECASAAARASAIPNAAETPKRLATPLILALLTFSEKHRLAYYTGLGEGLQGDTPSRARPMLEIPQDRCERHRLFKAIDEAFKAGDFAALGRALGASPRWFDEAMPFELGLGHPLEYAIYWSPLSFIEALIAAGSNVNYEDSGGSPALIATLSTDRHGRGDKLDVLQLLIRHGADLNQRGHNDWTPLHYAASIPDLEALRLLLAAGADPALRTRIDDYATALEEAEAAGSTEVAALLREAEASRHGG